MKTIAVLTSGGDAPGMNAAIRAVVRMAIHKGIRVMGVQRGYHGLIRGEIFEMHRESVSDTIHRGGTILRTARSEEFKTEAGIQKAVNVLRVFGIDGLVVIGGDGSFKGAQVLSQMGIATVGIPGTIDNDLSYSEYSIGFDTAVNTVLDAINKIRDTSSSHERISVVEVMGRSCGDIALQAAIGGGAETVIVPEKGFNIDDLCKGIFEGKQRGKIHNIIILAEGVGGAQQIAEQIEAITCIQTRATILGHIQRGGSPSAMDRILASKMGAAAVEVLVKGESGRVIGMRNGKIVDDDINTALAMPRVFDEELYEISRILSY